MPTFVELFTEDFRFRPAPYVGSAAKKVLKERGFRGYTIPYQGGPEDGLNQFGLFELVLGSRRRRTPFQTGGLTVVPDPGDIALRTLFWSEKLLGLGSGFHYLSLDEQRLLIKRRRRREDEVVAEISRSDAYIVAREPSRATLVEGDILLKDPNIHFPAFREAVGAISEGGYPKTYVLDELYFIQVEPGAPF